MKCVYLCSEIYRNICVLPLSETLVCKLLLLGRSARQGKNLFVSWLETLGLESCLLLHALGFLELEGCRGICSFAGDSAAASSPVWRGGIQVCASGLSIWAAAGEKEKKKEKKKCILRLANSAWIWHSGMSHHTIFLEGVVLSWLLTAYWRIKCLPGYNSEQVLEVASVEKSNCCNCAIFIHSSFFFPHYHICLWLVHLIHPSLCIWAPGRVPSEGSSINLRKSTAEVIFLTSFTPFPSL